MSREYIVIESSAPDDSPCICSNCEWTGELGDLSEPSGAHLEAGDPSPAGRCPECDSVAYLDRAQDRIRDTAEAFAKIAAELVFGADDSGKVHRAINAARKALDDCGLLIDQEAARAAGLLPNGEA